MLKDSKKLNEFLTFLCDIWINTEEWHWEFTYLTSTKFSKTFDRTLARGDEFIDKGHQAYQCTKDELIRLSPTIIQYKYLASQSYNFAPRQFTRSDNIPPQINYDSKSPASKRQKLTKPTKLSTAAKPFVPPSRPGANAFTTLMPNVRAFHPASSGYGQRSSQVEPLLKVIKKESSEGNKENLSPDGNRARSPFNSSKHATNDTSTQKLVTYSVTDLLRVFRSMGNFSSHCFTETQLKDHKIILLKSHKPEYTLEHEKFLENYSERETNPSNQFIDELNQELKKTGLFGNIDEEDDEDDFYIS